MPSPFFAFPLLFFLLFVFPSSTHSFQDDGQSLLSFKKLITSDPDNSMADWSSAVPFCNWTVVTCSRRHPNRVVAVNLTSMDLGGTISPSIGNLSFLRALDLSMNALHGHIPIQLGRLFRLRMLLLDTNRLEGNIPHQLCSCRNLVSLALSFNNLSGNIPGELGSLPHLQVLYLGANNFTEHQRISFQELQIATNGFIEANLLGTGSFGSVYKGILNDGTLVAVKVFQLQNKQVEKGFKAECSVLQKVRHRNLVRIITSCSNLNFKGLVFQFMSNGSLEKHLYHDRDDNNGEDLCQLGLKARINIAIDVAHAMEYLHHYSYVQVVHCDIKPSNVLLDEDMTGHVTDFGLAKLIGVASSDSLTSTLALKGSMGYVAPEYGLSEMVSTKGDVYSYGILLLEMFTRKRPTCDLFIGDLSLHKWVSLAFPNNVKEIIDRNLFSDLDGGDFEENNVYKCLLCLLRVGLLCSKDSPDERPTMRDVVIVLENLKEDLVENTIAFRRLGRSISSLLGNTNTTREGAPTSNDHSSTF